MGNLIIDIVKEFENHFGSKPYVVKINEETPSKEQSYNGIPSNVPNIFTDKGSLIAEKYRGVEIFLPVRFSVAGEEIFLPYCVVRIGGKKMLIETPLLERKGSVIEQYSIESETIDIKGFLIGENRKFPEKSIDTLYKAYKNSGAVILDNALTNIFLSGPGIPADEQKRVVIKSFDFPEVQGGRKYVRPFTMQVAGDSIFKLELE